MVYCSLHMSAKKIRLKHRTAKRANSVVASMDMYKYIAFTFVFVVAVILAVVLFISTVRATIFVYPSEEVLETQFILDVVPNPTRSSEIRGHVLSGSLGKNASFTPSGSGEKKVEGVATGVVTIFNETSLDQPLVVTTRLLTPDNVLFRIDESVTVPANGSVDVPAHADEAGATGDILDAKFTIPGLNSAKQKLIYAEVKDPFSGGLAVISVLSQDDIDAAIDSVVSELEEDGKVMLRAEVGEKFTGESFTISVVEQEVSEEADVEVESFDVRLTVSITGVFYDSEMIQQIAIQQLYDKLSTGREILDVKTDTMSTKIEKVDVLESMANIRVHLSGDTIVSRTSSTFEASRFVGMNEEQVVRTLIGDGVAEDVDVEFFPFWVKKVPKLADHIYIEIL
jgi:hypothetical protein